MVDAPEWAQRDALHPEDFQSSMKKKMFGPCCSDEFKVSIRSRYYALMAEYDAMIGLILDAVKEAGVLDNTWIIATSDHGDMKMEHAQYYKMVHWDSSSKVPAIIYGGNNFKMHRNVIRKDVVSSMLDWFPTIMEMAGIEWKDTAENVQLDGHSLMHYVVGSGGGDVEVGYEGGDEVVVYEDFEAVLGGDRPNYAMSQFHGDEIHLSWFLLRENEWKYVVYGSGKEVAPRLFNLKEDPQEMKDLAMDHSYSKVMERMDATLRTIVDYPAVAENVESYNKDSFVLWRDSFETDKEYKEYVAENVRWGTSWAFDSEGCFEAIDEWLKTPNDTFLWAFPEKGFDAK